MWGDACFLLELAAGGEDDASFLIEARADERRFDVGGETEEEEGGGGEKVGGGGGGENEPAVMEDFLLADRGGEGDADRLSSAAWSGTI